MSKIIFMLRKAKELLKKYNASFVITGEVLGQRPMTQNSRSMKIIEEQSGLAGYLLRPLCAKNLVLTEPEKSGAVDREKLLGFKGRSRKPQLALAREFKIEKFVKSPGGGCILTEKIYSKRLKDFITHNQQSAFAKATADKSAAAFSSALLRTEAVDSDRWRLQGHRRRPAAWGFFRGRG